MTDERYENIVKQYVQQGWPRSWAEIVADIRRRDNYEFDYQAALKRFNRGAKYINGKRVRP